MVPLHETGTLQNLRDRLETGVCALIPKARLNGSADARLPNVLNLTLPDLLGESIVVAMDQRGIAFSSGSACKSGSPDPTHVLLAMGCSPAEATARCASPSVTRPEKATSRWHWRRWRMCCMKWRRQCGFCPVSRFCCMDL